MPSGKFRYSKDQIEEIFVELRDGRLITEIAKDFKCSTAMIQHINNGRSYKIENFRYPVKQVDNRKKRCRD